MIVFIALKKREELEAGQLLYLAAEEPHSVKRIEDVSFLRTLHLNHSRSKQMSHTSLIDAYLAGPGKLREAVAGMTDEQLDATPISGTWSTRQVVCHIADFEPIYADRMKRALAEDNPTVFGGEPNAFAAHLAYEQRDVEEELQLIESVRAQMVRILRTLEPAAFQRAVKHSESGPITLETLLTNITNHIPHHQKFIEEKRAAL